MRILFISNSTAKAGAPLALLHLVKGLLALGHEAAVVLPDKKGPLYKELAALGVTCWCDHEYGLTVHPKCINPFKRHRRMKALKGINTLRAYVGYVIDEFQPDIVHTNVGPLDLALDACRDRHIPHVWHMREYQDLDFGMEFYPSREVFEERIHLQGNFNVAITQGVYDHWKLRICDRVIYDGVFSAAAAAPFAEPDRKQYFLYAARIEKAKGLDKLLGAFKRFRKEHPEYQLLVAGRSCGLYGLRQKMRAGAGVKFLGVRDDVYQLMREAAALVVPSRFEGFGFTTAEAMLNRCIVIGRDTGGTREQMDNGLRRSGREIGLRFTTTKGLAEQMAFVAEHPEALPPIRDAARKVVSECYTVEQYKLTIFFPSIHIGL